MQADSIQISVATPAELHEIGNLMAEVYSQLDGFPSKQDQPSYYEQFYSLPEMVESPLTSVIVAKNEQDIVGGIIYFSDMSSYGAGGTATTSIKNASGIRLLAVSADAQGHGIGRKLTEHCIELARSSGRSRVILHTTHSMPAAWRLYERLGFARFYDLDFMQGELEVFGFQLAL